MKNVQISNELYEKLKDFVVDPFDDTPETVIGRVVDIACKAKTRWSPLDAYGVSEMQTNAESQTESESQRKSELQTERDQQTEESLVTL